MCNFILDIVVRFRPIRYVAPRSTQHDLSDLQRALLDVLGQGVPLGLSDIEETLDTEVSTRAVQRQLKTLRELDLVELEDIAEELQVGHDAITTTLTTKTTEKTPRRAERECA